MLSFNTTNNHKLDCEIFKNTNQGLFDPKVILQWWVIPILCKIIWMGNWLTNVDSFFLSQEMKIASSVVRSASSLFYASSKRLLWRSIAAMISGDSNLFLSLHGGCGIWVFSFFIYLKLLNNNYLWRIGYPVFWQILISKMFSNLVEVMRPTTYNTVWLK